MSLNGQLVRWEPLRELAFGAISGAYTPIGGGYLNGVRSVMFDNTTNDLIRVSFDGVTDHTVVPSQSGRVIDYASNRVGSVDQLEQAQGTVVYIKGTPSSGSVFVSVYYAANR